MKFRGVYRIRKTAPGFGIPLFDKGKGVVCPYVKEDDIIAGFSYVDITDSIILPATNIVNVPKVGDKLLYAFHFSEKVLLVDTKEKLYPILKDVFEYLKETSPYVAMDVAYFLGEKFEYKDPQLS